MGSSLERVLKMVLYSVSLILETVAASMHGVGRLGNIKVLAGDTLKDLGLSRLRLLAVLIDLEDKFAIEFPADTIDGFRNVDDITLYIYTHAMTPDENGADEQPRIICHSIDRRLSVRDHVRRAYGQACLWCTNPAVAPHTGSDVGQRPFHKRRAVTTAAAH